MNNFMRKFAERMGRIEEGESREPLVPQFLQ
jgi:hypothetical protein